MSLFVSTAIPYVNAAPHLGFVLEIVLADAIARHARMGGHDVRFVTGTDENSLKNVRAAEAAGVSTRALVDANAEKYRALEGLVGASFDDFVRTSADPRHARATFALWEACAGKLEKRAYRGLYCVGCEQFYEPADLIGGRCAEHGTVPEVIEEDNWFFRLSAYGEPIARAIASGALRIHPRERANEVARVLEEGLRDVSVSRSRARARGWGLAVPGDPSQVIYVWFDALANYLSTLGWPDDAQAHARYWRGAERRVHVIGKGITRFHALFWPALLLAADLPLPTDLCVHGYVTASGEKIGKSRGNAIDPGALVARFGRDAVRYFLLRHVGPQNDADVDPERIARAYDAELADGLGNLVSRALGLVRRAGEIGAHDGASLAQDLEAKVDDAMARFATDEALRAIWQVVGAANKHLADRAPWALLKSDPPAGRAVLACALDAIARVGRALAPFLPDTSDAIARALADPQAPAPILFPKAS